MKIDWKYELVDFGFFYVLMTGAFFESWLFFFWDWLDLFSAVLLWSVASTLVVVGWHGIKENARKKKGD